MIIDTHTHLDGIEFKEDIQEVVERARNVGVSKVLVPAIDLNSIESINYVCKLFPNFAYPMLGLHPEEVKDDYQEVLKKMKTVLLENNNYIAVGEIGLDFYWSREFEKEQLIAFEEQVKWSIETRLPLMIHCRKAQNEMVKILGKYKDQLPGGVFHCFTGNEKEAAELLSFDNFVLGIGGVLTFKKSNLPETLKSVPLQRIVLETDSPYMAPVPLRGKRNESSFLIHIVTKLAEVYNTTEDEIAIQTNKNVERIFGIY
ncbi:TatD family hydrolase [Prevotella aurantiaca JCM 15754]|jgi:hydrolase, tatD family|uniref:TatD family hydrolase n=1 Tax=Prevotella aurantiaca TaxID=596085 RepID=A0A930N0I5_9BACT|nr:TatD family hydrolase [Prevotella aurantiaca]MBF1385151.1 TatD family hydrolase [Prevotella aurantiaca]MBF1386414.1 TatD family hydrolase [Prevotella aurantiaca]